MTHAIKKRSRKSRFFVLGFSLGTAFDGQDDAPPAVVCTTGYNSARILALRLPSGEGRSLKNLGQWRLAIEVERRDQMTAQRVLSGFEGLFTQLFHGQIEELSLEPLPARAISGRRILYPHFLSAAERSARKSGDLLLARSAKSRIQAFHQVADIINAFLLYQVPTVLQSDPLFAACGFFQAACAEFEFTGDSIGNVLRDKEKTTDYERDRQKLEAVVLSSFRVLESLVGEPGKGEKFRARLAARGLSYDERVGFRGTKRTPLGEAIYRLQELRDSTSAHGVRRRKKPVTWFEAMNAQHLAESVLHQALWHECCTKGRPEGGQEELTYLLTGMYPMCADSGWLTRPFSELGGRTPIEASREPNGPAKVQSLAERISETAHLPIPAVEINDLAAPTRGGRAPKN